MQTIIDFNMYLEISLVVMLMALPAWVKFGGINRMFYQNKRNAVVFNHQQLKAITTKTQDDVELGGFHIKPINESHTTILYMHGIGFQPESKIPRLIEFANKMQANIICLNYRGYAYSQPAPCSEAAIQLDAQAMIDYCKNNCDGKVFLMGKSFGVAVACYAATELSFADGMPAQSFFKGLIFDSGFTSATDVIK